MATTDSWATITSSSQSTILPDSISTVNGTNNADTIRTKPIDHTVRAIYGNSVAVGSPGGFGNVEKCRYFRIE